MKNLKNYAWFLLFGSMWGISEVAAGGVLYGSDIPHSSIILTAWAMFILAMARGIVNKPGSSTVIGAVATLFKLANAAPFICHLAGIFALGIAFDIFASILLKKESKVNWRSGLTGIAGAYGGYSLFAFFITYIIRYEYWAAEGLPKVLNHIFQGGSIAALISAVIVPLGFFAGLRSGSLSEKSPRWIYAGTMAGVVLLWILGRFAG